MSLSFGQIMVSESDCDHHCFVTITFVLYLSLLSVLLRMFGEQIVFRTVCLSVDEPYQTLSFALCKHGFFLYSLFLHFK